MEQQKFILELTEFTNSLETLDLNLSREELNKIAVETQEKVTDLKTNELTILENGTEEQKNEITNLIREMERQYDNLVYKMECRMFETYQKDFE